MTPSSRTISRRKSKKGTNRYNPNKPDWNAVHKPWWLSGFRIRKAA